MPRKMKDTPKPPMTRAQIQGHRNCLLGAIRQSEDGAYAQVDLAVAEALVRAVDQLTTPPDTGGLDALDRNTDALLAMDATGNMVPHGIGGLAREILTKQREAIHALRARLAYLEGPG